MNQPPLFPAVISKLEAHYGRPEAPRTNDALGLILYENIAYLSSDEKRDAAFETLRAEVGFEPTQILASPTEKLVAITRLGGIHAELRAARLKEIAQIVVTDFAGNLDSVLSLPQPQARKALQKFPSIGAPGADKILLFTGTAAVLALESNGLRVLRRLGFGEERRNYAATYVCVQETLRDEIGNDCDFLIVAHQLLRRHGQELCQRNNPACEICPVNSWCAYYRSNRNKLTLN
jgi:endonuclease III